MHLDELNDWLEALCIALWSTIRHGHGMVADAWALARPQLMALVRPFDGFVEHTKRVSPTCLVTFERTRYSVPAQYATVATFLAEALEPLVGRAHADTGGMGCLFHTQALHADAVDKQGSTARAQTGF